MTCTWPNGESRTVMVTAIGAVGYAPVAEGMARILWNEKVESDCKAVTGFDDVVPTEWLTE